MSSGQDDRDRIERELRSRLAEKGVIAEPVSVESVAGGLGEDVALVSYFRYRRRFERGPRSGEDRRSVDSLVAFVLTPDRSVRRIELGPAEPLESLTREWLDPGQRDVERERGRTLREQLLDPCLAAVGEELPSTLHVVLDDFLHLVPLEALPWKDDRRTGEVIVRAVSRRRCRGAPLAPPGVRAPGGSSSR